MKKAIVQIDLEFVFGPVLKDDQLSKTCYCCGYKNENLTLSTRQWICQNCGTLHDRDANAAINIKNEGLRLLTLN